MRLRFGLCGDSFWPEGKSGRFVSGPRKPVSPMQIDLGWPKGESMDGQLSFATLDYAGKKKRTKRDVFLAEICRQAQGFGIERWNWIGYKRCTSLRLPRNPPTESGPTAF